MQHRTAGRRRGDFSIGENDRSVEHTFTMHSASSGRFNFRFLARFTDRDNVGGISGPRKGSYALARWTVYAELEHPQKSTNSSISQFTCALSILRLICKEAASGEELRWMVALVL